MRRTLAAAAALTSAVRARVPLAVELGPAWPIVAVALAGAVLLLALLVATLVVLRARRLRRERAWLERQVDVRTCGPDAVLSDAPEEPGPGLAIRLDLRLERPGDELQQEVGLPHV